MSETTKDALSASTVWSAVLWQPGVQAWRLVGTEGTREHALSEAADWKREIYDGECIAIASQDRAPWSIYPLPDEPRTRHAVTLSGRVIWP